MPLRGGRNEMSKMLRPVPGCPWWPYLRSLRTQILVGTDGRVPAGTERLRVAARPTTKVIHCQDPNGSITILANEPNPITRPVIPLQIHAP